MKLTKLIKTANRQGDFAFERHREESSACEEMLTETFHQASYLPCKQEKTGRCTFSWDSPTATGTEIERNYSAVLYFDCFVFSSPRHALVPIPIMCHIVCPTRVSSRISSRISVMGEKLGGRLVGATVRLCTRPNKSKVNGKLSIWGEVGGSPPAHTHTPPCNLPTVVCQHSSMLQRG